MELEPGLRILAQIDFTLGGNLDHFGHSGFSVPEPAGTWGLGEQSSILLPHRGSLDRLSLRARLQPCLLPGQGEFQSLAILVNGVVVSSHVFRSTEWAELEIRVPDEILPTDGLHFGFRHPDFVIPASGGNSSDTRNLSFMFHSMLVTGVWDDIEGSAPVFDQEKDAASALTPEPRGDVHRGRDGWLFLIGGSNNVLRYYCDPEYFSDDHAERWSGLLIDRATRLHTCGIDYLHISAPDKITVYPEQFGLPTPNFGRHPIRLLRDRLEVLGYAHLLIDPTAAFQSHPLHKRLYLKTDTHWTYLAGQVVVMLVLQRLGITRTLDLQGRELHHYDLIWDLGSKMVPAVSEQSFAVTTNRGVTRVHANALALAFEENVRTGRPVTHQSIYSVFHNSDPAAINMIVVIFGDSFLDFQESNTTTIFAENFREVHFVWSPNIDFEFVERVGAKLVITELAERFMITLPTDVYTVAV